MKLIAIAIKLIEVQKAALTKYHKSYRKYCAIFMLCLFAHREKKKRNKIRMESIKENA